MLKIMINRILSIAILSSFVFVFASCDFQSEDIDDRDLYVGTYKIDEYSSLLNESSFKVELDKHGNRDKMVIRNFYDTDLEVQADLAGRKLQIDYQRVGDYYFEGVGQLTDSTVRLTFDVYNAQGSSVLLADSSYRPAVYDVVDSWGVRE